MEGKRWSLWLLLILAGIVVVALLGQRVSSVDETGGSGRLLYLVLLLCAVGGGVFHRFKTEPGTAFAQLGIWIALLAGLTLAYSFKDDVKALRERLTHQDEGEQAVTFEQ